MADSVDPFGTDPLKSAVVIDPAQFGATFQPSFADATEAQSFIDGVEAALQEAAKGGDLNAVIDTALGIITKVVMPL